MSRKKWVVAPADRELAREIADECDIDSLIALILVARGYTDPFEVEEFLSDDQQLCDPFELVDMDKAVERINSAITAGEKICVYGDYDADGVTSTAMLYTYLQSKGADVSYIVPEREENYGLNFNAVDRMTTAGVTLMITVDNGINAIDEIDYANKNGIDVVVTDHHLPQSELPKAVAIVDPHRVDCPSYFKHYAGAGVCFKLICALEGASGEEMCAKYADLAAVGTIADVMPLTGENRLIVCRGMEHIESARVGFSAIMDVAGLRKRGVNAVNVSFGIAPRLNAAGRVGSCDRAVKLLISKDRADADRIAQDINEANVQRQTLERQISEQAIALIEEQGLEYDRVIVVCGEGWHHGVIGIVASRICERYGRPAIVLSVEGKEASGSARSVGDFSLYNAISACESLLNRFGGHAQAAGLSMPAEKVADFRRMINKYAADEYGDMPFSELRIDCKLRPTAFTPDLVHSLEVLAPFGTGNSVPVFGLFGMKIERLTSVGASSNHLRLELSREGASVTVMYFGRNAERFGYEVGDLVDLAVTAEISEYSGREQVTLSAKGIRPAGIDEDRLLGDIRLYERLRRSEELGAAKGENLLTRDRVAAVYRAVRKGFDGEGEALLSRVGDCSYLQLRLCLDVLEEVGLIASHNQVDRLSIAPIQTNEKTELTNSALYRAMSAN